MDYSERLRIYNNQMAKYNETVANNNRLHNHNATLESEISLYNSKLYSLYQALHRINNFILPAFDEGYSTIQKITNKKEDFTGAKRDYFDDNEYAKLNMAYKAFGEKVETGGTIGIRGCLELSIQHLEQKISDAKVTINQNTNAIVAVRMPIKPRNEE